MSIFVGENGLRHGWRSVIGFAAVLLATACATIAAQGALGGSAAIEQSPLRNAAYSLLVGVAAVAATRVIARRLDRAPLSSIGLGGDVRTAARELGVGMLWGAGLFTLALAPLLATGKAHLTWVGGPALGLAELVVALAAAAVFEEVALRGYAFQHAARGLGPWPATALFAMLFGLAHAGNPGFSGAPFTMVTLAGVLLAVTLLRTGRLYMAIGLHFAWNVVEGLVFGVAVSGHGGESAPVPTLFRVALDGPLWLTGGDFGLEGGITAGLALALGILILRPKTPRLPGDPPPPEAPAATS